MSYVAGIGPSMKRLGFTPGPPMIVCDKCDMRYVIHTDRAPPRWFLDGRAPPLWQRRRNGDQRLDYCPDCKVWP